MSGFQTPRSVAEGLNSDGEPKPEPKRNGPVRLAGRERLIETLKAILRTVVIFGLIVLAIKGSLFAFKEFKTDSQSGHSDLEIVAGIQSSTAWDASGSNTFSLTGRVLYQGEPVTNARVWCIARDASGNRFSPTNWPINAGVFRFEGMPGELRQMNSEIRVFARANIGTSVGSPSLRGEAVIMTQGVARQVNIMDSKLWPCTLAFFCVGIFVGLAVHVVDPEWRRQLYIASVITALALTAGMLSAIAEAYMNVKASVTPGQTWSVGFISIFEGTYVKDLPQQWLLSLTGPPHDGTSPGPSASQAPELVQGFGAPMWVIFLAVIGAALHTVTLVVNEIRSPPCFLTNDPAELRKRMLCLVQNQFFMLFAPLGGIFVYQGLVLAGAAVQPFVVALAAMGAGATLNIVLSLAVSKAADALMPNSEKNRSANSSDSSPGVQEGRTTVDETLVSSGGGNLKPR